MTEDDGAREAARAARHRGGGIGDRGSGDRGARSAPYRVCFVCSGNICRSPMAEAVFRARLEEAGLDGLVETDSAGTGGWHIGDPADPRTAAVLDAAGYGLAHEARQYERAWFAGHDLVVALDEGHRRELRALAPTREDAAKVRLLRSYDPAASEDGVHGLQVPDPYYGGERGFEECLRLVEAAMPGLMAEVGAALDARGRRDGRQEGQEGQKGQGGQEKREEREGRDGREGADR